MKSTTLNNIISRHTDERRRNYILDNYTRILADVQYINSHYLSSTHPIDILNIGSDPFLLEDLMQISYPSAYCITSVDIGSDWAAQYAAMYKHKLAICDIEKDLISEIIDLSKFKLVVMTEIFEHLRIDILSTLSNLYHSMPSKSCLYNHP